MEELFPLIGFEEQYGITKTGKIYSYYTQSFKIPRLSSPNGYLKINLSKNGKTSTHYIHRLVALQFIPNPENFPQVHHLDENKMNNSVENLKWVSAQENINAGTGQERRVKTRLENGGYPVPSSAIKILQIDISIGKVINKFNSIKEAGRFLGKPAGHINEVVNGKRKTAYGYYWKNSKDQ